MTVEYYPYHPRNNNEHPYRNPRMNACVEDFITLRQEMYKELLQTGSCDMIQKTLTNPRLYLANARYPLLYLSAVRQALDAVAKGSNLVNEIQPYFIIGNDEYDIFDSADQVPIEELIRVHKPLFDGLKNKSAAIRNWIRNANSGPNSTPANQQAQTAELENARNELLRKAQQQADQIITDARQQAAQILAKANQDAQEREAQASADEKFILDQATKNAQRIRDEAQMEARQIRDDATLEADEILEEAKLQAAEEAQQLLRDELLAYMQEQRRLWEKEQEENDAVAACSARETAILKDHVIAMNTQLGTNFSQTLEQLQAQLDTLKAETVRDLNKWRASLYHFESDVLVNYYSLLSGITKRFQREALALQIDENASEEFKALAKEHSNSLNRLHSALLRAMERMGLQLFEPRTGDVFDSYYHSVKDAEDDDDYLDQIIEACENPGIERVVNGQETSVLLRATVTLRPDQDQCL